MSERKKIYDRVADIFSEHGLRFSEGGGGEVRGEWLDQKAHDRCSIDLILYHYDKMGVKEKERALKALRCKREDLFFDTGKSCDAAARIIDYQKKISTAFTTSKKKKTIK